ncbi:transcriptional regulatory protein resD [Actinoplanes sp. SE50]|uniref:response regulator n=1 Tax=unclassified Actinoplanes TaxID=2626549 RepID=UPI00023EC32D|nr:Transcriptional regulatory protein resD [Actinoplanes sp. SE50/110]ATO84788.1 transcriptional regulatory protein resD [Actinoplanes sp. SE50]SLM02198.1 two-component system response regulator, winged helix family [Actinoplanes sp. SE50/110]
MRLSIVEDERELAESLRRGLTAEGYPVDVAHDGSTGLEFAMTHAYQVDPGPARRRGRAAAPVRRRRRAPTPQPARRPAHTVEVAPADGDTADRAHHFHPIAVSDPLRSAPDGYLLIARSVGVTVDHR